MPPDKFEKEKIAYDALLRDIHTIDQVAEVHARTVIITLSGLLAFVVGFVRSPFLVSMASLVGLLISLLFLLKTIRHRRIFREQRDRLSRLEDLWELPHDVRATRPLKSVKYPNIFSFDGFTLLGWAAFLLILFWLFLIISAYTGLFPTGSVSRTAAGAAPISSAQKNDYTVVEFTDTGNLTEALKPYQAAGWELIQVLEHKHMYRVLLKKK